MNAVTAVVGYPVHAVAAIKAPSRAGGSGVMSWPTPEVPARVASDAEVPAGARRVAMGAIAAGWVVAATLIGIPVAVLIWAVAAIWVIYRVVRGYLAFNDSKPVPGM